MLDGGVEVFLEERARLKVFLPGMRAEVSQLLRLHLARVQWGLHGDPACLFPFTREATEDAPRVVVIDPRVAFGEPCLAEAGVGTAVIWERFSAADSIANLARDYGRPTSEVEEAVRFESRGVPGFPTSGY
jgi:uncharacterized protein (DUF433 family)